MRERERTLAGKGRERERERERERILSRLCTHRVGLEPTNPEIMTSAETESDA